MSLLASLAAAIVLALAVGLGMSAPRLEVKPPPAVGGPTVLVHPKSAHEGILVGWIYGNDGKPLKDVNIEINTSSWEAPGRSAAFGGQLSQAKSGANGRFAVILGRDQFSPYDSNSPPESRRPSSTNSAVSKIPKGPHSVLLSVNHFGGSRRTESRDADGNVVGSSSEPIFSRARGCFDVEYGAATGFVVPEISVRAQATPDSDYRGGLGRQLGEPTQLYARLIDGKPYIYDGDRCHDAYTNRIRYGTEADGNIFSESQDGSVTFFDVPDGVTETSGYIRGQQVSAPTISPPSSRPGVQVQGRIRREPSQPGFDFEQGPGPSRDLSPQGPQEVPEF